MVTRQKFEEQRRGEGWGVRTDYQDTAIRKRARDPGPGARLCVYGFVFLGSIICRLHELTLSRQAQFTLQRRVSLFDVV